MVILGLSDGAAPGAALVVDDRVVAVEPARASELSGLRLPLAAAERALRQSGLQVADVSLVSLAGRYSPPLAVRSRPRVRRWATDPFSPARAFTTRAERWLRGTGLGAADADRARDWLSGVLVARGYQPKKVVLIDLHRALAASVYRTRPDDRATIVVVHPEGDGVFASVHRAQGGQVDRVLADRATTGVHLYLERALAALGLPELSALPRLAGTAEPDPALRSALSEVAAYTGRYTGRPGPERRGDQPWSALRKAPAVGAATVIAHLRELVADLVSHHQLDGATQLAGGWFADLGVLGLPGAAPLGVAAWRGDEALALGAAVDAGGVAPTPLAVDLGAWVQPAGDGPEVATHDDVVAVLTGGAPWIRCRDRGAVGPLALRNRGVWLRADDARGLARVREALELPSAVPTVYLRATEPVGVPENVRDCWAFGVTVGGRTFVGAAGNPALEARLQTLAAAGIDEVALLPLARRDHAPVEDLASLQALAGQLGGSLEWSDRYEPRRR